jgi:hypothetical protein
MVSERAFLVGRKGSTEEAAKPAASVAQIGGDGDATTPMSVEFPV